MLVSNATVTHSLSRGDAQHFTIKAGDRTAEDAALGYADSPIAELRDPIRLEWDAMDGWFEEDEEVYTHPRDPYTRVDIQQRPVTKFSRKERTTMPNETAPNETAHQTRLERILGVPLAEDAVRQWPQSGELLEGRARIGEVESHFTGLRLGVGRRHALGDTIVVEWSTDYGDGRVYRNISIAELHDGKAVRVTDYWGEPFTAPAWREALATRLDMPRDGVWPAGDVLQGD
jgi:hypothetical protein